MRPWDFGKPMWRVKKGETGREMGSTRKDGEDAIWNEFLMFIRSKFLYKEAAAAGVKLLCFPENFSFVSAKDGESLKIAEPLDGPIMQRYCSLARFDVDVPGNMVYKESNFTAAGAAQVSLSEINSAPAKVKFGAQPDAVIAAAQAGRHNEKRESYGDSLIIDPWGTIIARHPDRLSTGIAVADIDLSRIDSVRTRMPISEHRRFSSCWKPSCI
ncbi:putative nitrilase-like protein 2 [Cocos nucifera]|uniref:Putative nitrilase-like protein 2 n=1 Tax=Cocos nucifera TaxID=13894 RepID=A0A8K0I838_COCNU|nr:putative nitrilase-like protein 2 [Cocos nucifera]